MLGTYGRESLERLYNVRPDGWSQADLLLLVDLAVTEEQLRTQRMVAQMVPTVVTLSNGVTARHPIHAVVADLQKQKRDLCRDLGIRSKDGAPAAPAHTTPATEATPAADGPGGFEAWLDAQMESHGGH
ncbi:hypothetical protein [Ruegeria arenilitoris]|uniref:hypothetical protein n=1 Tax=Ruegeria arenilitoris TaxID=1173585 RepID=UPI00147DE6CE|nr:hypothetical protein [Ruegeria arenilitoris]